MAGALSILRTTLFLTRTFVLVQRARAISCICLPEEQKWPRDPFIIMELWFLIVIIVNVLNLKRSCCWFICYITLYIFHYYYYYYL